MPPVNSFTQQRAPGIPAAPVLELRRAQLSIEPDDNLTDGALIGLAADNVRLADASDPGNLAQT